MKKIAILASGSGSNAEKIATYFAGSTEIEVSIILTNNKNAGVIDRAARLQIPVLVFNKKTFYNTSKVLDVLKVMEVDLVVLAGFMMLMPEDWVHAFPNKIVNIHPALLPKFGGKGMYGHFVHEAVVEAKEKESGITIHYVNERYDEGQIIYQASCEVTPTDTPDDVAAKIQVLEHTHFPRIIHELLK